MNKFKTLFGVKETEIKSRCIIIPILNRDILAALGNGELKKGLLYSVINQQDFTIIRTGQGPSLCADAVLYLKKTPCQQLILFGSCGLVKKTKQLNLSSIVNLEKSYNLESFSDLLNQNILWRVGYPDKRLYNILMEMPGIHKAAAATVGSLKLEEDLIDLFVKKGVEVVEMESSAFFTAANHCKLPAAAICYVTDILKKKPFYAEFSPQEKFQIVNAAKIVAKKICNLLQANTTGLKK